MSSCITTRQNADVDGTFPNLSKFVEKWRRFYYVVSDSYKPTSIWYVVWTSHRRREVVSQPVDIFPAKIPTALRQSNLVEIDVALATSYQRLYNVENRRRYRRPFVTSYWRPRDVEKLTVIYAPKLRPLIDESTLLA